MDKDRYNKILEFVKANLFLENIIDEVYANKIAESLYNESIKK